MAGRDGYDWGQHWAAFLETQMKQRTMSRTQFVDASPLKPNGRPEIDHTVLGRWLHGQRPTFDKAVMAADILGMDAALVVRQAGFIATPNEPLVIEEDQSEHVIVRLDSDEEARAVAEFLKIWRSRN